MVAAILCAARRFASQDRVWRGFGLTRASFRAQGFFYITRIGQRAAQRLISTSRSAGGRELRPHPNRCSAASPRATRAAPQGAIPLGGCSVDHYSGPVPPKFRDLCILIQHPSFGERQLVVAAEDESAFREWLDALRDCRHVCVCDWLLRVAGVDGRGWPR